MKKIDINAKYPDGNYAQRQINRDRELRPKRKRNYTEYNDIVSEKLRKLKLARHYINDLQEHGPAGLIHVAVLSNVIKRPIRIWMSNDRLIQTIGQKETNQQKSKNPVDIEYHQSEVGDIGHWTLRGNKDPLNIVVDLNECLFTTVAAQTSVAPCILRKKTADKLMKSIQTLADKIDDILWFEKNNINDLMTGGARYNGTSARAASIILDNSQNALCHGCRDVGHPRGHASDKNATGPLDSVENYSRTTSSMKSGFLSKCDQNTVAHLALLHGKAQHAMESLNSGNQSVAIHLTAAELKNNGNELPKMKEYYNGEEYSEELAIRRVTLVLRHFQGKFNDREADVFVHTFYPRSS